MNNKENLMGFVSLIVNPGIRDFTEQILDVVPEVFWTARASKDHHPEDERGSEGNVIHTERVVKIVRIMSDSCQLTPDEIDVLTSAAILHDAGRYGPFGTEEYTVPDHPSLIRGIAGNHVISCAHDADIFSLIERHSGRWGDPVYWPQVTPAAMLHLADTISAHAEQIWPIGETLKSDWVGATPFQEIGMTKEKMQLLRELGPDSDYWKSALGFINQITSRKLSSLTNKQKNWLRNIEAGLSEELNKREEEYHNGVNSDDLEPEDMPF